MLLFNNSESLKESIQRYNPLATLPKPIILPVERSWKKQFLELNMARQELSSQAFETDRRLNSKLGMYKTFFRTMFGLRWTVPILVTRVIFPFGRRTDTEGYCLFGACENNSSLQIMWSLTPESIIHVSIELVLQRKILEKFPFLSLVFNWFRTFIIFWYWSWVIVWCAPSFLCAETW